MFARSVNHSVHADISGSAHDALPHALAKPKPHETSKHHKILSLLREIARQGRARFALEGGAAILDAISACSACSSGGSADQHRALVCQRSHGP